MTRRPMLRLVLGLLFALAALPARAGTTLDRIHETGTIRIGLTGDYRPFSAYDARSGDFSGLDVDLARSLARRLGAKAVFVKTSWPALGADLQANRFDIVMGGVSVTPERAKLGLFSEPVLSDGKTPIARCEKAKKFRTLYEIDRKGVKVIVNPGGTNEKFVRAHLRNATIILHKDNTTIFDEIVAGRADLMITDAIETRLQAKLHKELCAVHPEKPFDRSEKAYLMANDPALKRAVNKWLAGAKRSGELAHEIGKWVE
ncbi:MAG TPA: transporter substrate-binding domain-containing protein [Parvibaculum sp.]